MSKKARNENTATFDAALEWLLLYHKACALMIHNREYPNEDKADLAKHLYFLGAVDCSSQRHNLSDTQFANLIEKFFCEIGANEMYINLLGVFFLKMESVPLAKNCVIEGGENFNKWINANSMIPICTIQALEKYCDTPNFPVSVGHLYTEIEKP